MATPHRALALLLLLAGVCAQAQYRWVGADGQVNYGDQPPKDARQLEQLGPVNGVIDRPDAIFELPYEVRRAAQDFPVMLYARPECHVCDDARAFLKARAIPFAERSVITRADIVAFHELGGGDQLPALSVGRQMLRGYEPVSWGETLSVVGYPQGVPLPGSWRWPTPTPLAPTPAAGSAPAGGAGTGAAGNNP